MRDTETVRWEIGNIHGTTLAARGTESPRRAFEMGQGSQMVYCHTKHRQNERQSLTGLCREYTLTPCCGALLYVAVLPSLLSPHRLAFFLRVLWVSFWCHGIGLDRNGDRQLVGASLVPLHSLAMSERSDRFSGDQERSGLCVCASF